MKTISIYNENDIKIFETLFDDNKSENIINTPWLKHSKPYVVKLENNISILSYCLSKRELPLLRTSFLTGDIHCQCVFTFGSKPEEPSYRGTITIKKVTKCHE